MNQEQDTPRGERLASAALAALTIIVGWLFCCGALCVFVRAAPSATRAEATISPLGRLTLFGAVGTSLVALGLHGLRPPGRRGGSPAPAQQPAENRGRLGQRERLEEEGVGRPGVFAG